MMDPLDLQSEAVRPTGNIVSEGVLNQLGRPRMDRLTLLVREAGQNSWDARAADATTVQFAVDLYALSEAQRHILRDTIFRQLPSGVRLEEALDHVPASPLRLLAISDRGTRGLGGPTRADRVGAPGESRDFVDFMRNVGEPPHRVAGGTYGYGKAAFYLAGVPRTIIAYTRSRSAGHIESRFMAAALGDNHIANGVRYTGRHWWGRLADGVVEPVTGHEADELARALGLPERDGRELGTTIAVLDPRLDQRTPASASAHIVEVILWHFWPKMLRADESPPAMEFHVACDGIEIPVPDPRAMAPLNGFAEAMDMLKGRAVKDPIALDAAVQQIASQRPVADLGRLALVKFGHQPRQRMTEDHSDGAWVVPDLAHHVALMRGPELVVKYVEGPVLPGAAVEYAGVFLVDPSVEAAFAKAEPPTHDDWVPENLESDWEKRYVRIAQRRIWEVLQDYAAPQAAALSTASSAGGLGGFSDELGSLFLGEASSGLSVTNDRGASGRGSRGGVRSRQPRLHAIHDGSRLEFFEGRRALRVEFSVEHVPGSTRSIVMAATSALLEGRLIETDPPIGVRSPEVLCWVGPDGSRYPGDRVVVSGRRTGTWSVYVSVPADAAVIVDLQAKSDGVQ